MKLKVKVCGSLRDNQEPATRSQGQGEGSRVPAPALQGGPFPAETERPCPLNRVGVGHDSQRMGCCHWGICGQ